MSFSFGFSGDDIDGDQNGESGAAEASKAMEDTAAVVDVPVVKHDLEELLTSLPSRISYTATLVTSPLGKQTIIPRRALFDVRLQMMAESPMSSGTQKKDPIDVGLTGQSDIERNVYEGGFKSWEGALDLAMFLLDRGPRKDLDEIAGLDGVVELGAGTALPSLILFQHALRTEYTLPFTLADYNSSVLRLVTLPNLLLIWALQHAPSAFDPAPPALNPAVAADTTVLETIQNADGDLNSTPDLLSSFLTHTTANNPLALLSGPWSPTLSTHILAQLPASASVLLLASEVLYSLTSLRHFSQLLTEVLGKVRAGKALVAGKKVYFGVGGGVGEFKALMGELGAVVGEVDWSSEGGGGGGGGGVGRCICEVQML